MGQPEAQERKIEKERKVASATVEDAPKKFSSENADDELSKVPSCPGTSSYPLSLSVRTRKSSTTTRGRGRRGA